ncbi:ATP-dependent DNA helicase RecG [Candidatus Roizmanbacteria bacterium RIFCSPHIGHO2_12_FULL_33_9]|uniref:ATP-dependent DNA helicase RecG n=1 Tax=Candidatus Roizmanbacteria bacterium RIFCSPHIGHO2_12_FULL_33_9 TaxID=1802045 RepID=A0A1F7HJ02_9BACT|nr:MAG: ATP-dependent DNA helicase RecG [Candidatus Roizmanbacteria bacterium RIFCSPHIGHO2_12_FULL_33_9]
MLNTPVENLPYTSILTIRKMRSLGIKTYWDLINYFPFRYDDFTTISEISKAQEGDQITIKGQIQSVKSEFTRNRLNIQKVEVFDGTDKITLVWFNQYYLIRLLKEGGYLSVSGEIKYRGKKKQLFSKSYELLRGLNQETIHTGRLVPVYPEKSGLSSRTIREKIFYVLGNSDLSSIEIFPNSILRKYNLVPEPYAYQQIHFPKDKLTSHSSRQRLSFDELFIVQLAAQIVRNNWKKEKTGYKLNIKKFDNHIKQFIKSLPFELTNAQKKSTKEMLGDMSKDIPMNRFLQGDVGAGKTVVAAIGCMVSHLNNYQSLFMAPTEILANQHYQTLTELFSKIKNPPKITLITGSIKASRESLAKSDIVIGTHALFTQKLEYNKVGFVVIDEQHRFGVVQRALLKEKGMNPHLLTMTATPIPRTAALTLYGELDLSELDEMPKYKAQTKTYYVPKKKRKKMYLWIREKIISEKTQVFIICPLIDESEHETMKTVKAATKEYERLSTKVFPDLTVDLLHGRMKAAEKESIMQKFKNNDTQILVSTSVVEVGIDIKNATIMVIEGAERYGLAQLHQLRGRIGRGSVDSYCLIFSEKENPRIESRLKFFSKNNNGSKIAEYDLQHRGYGELFGTRQHGLFELKIASLTDFKTIKNTKTAVQEILKDTMVDDLDEKIKQRLSQYNIERIARD